jgi:hypothetical protein
MDQQTVFFHDKDCPAGDNPVEELLSFAIPAKAQADRPSPGS